jgi:hypothetical protein
MVNRKIATLLLVTLTVMITAAACNREKAGGDATETIAPAQPQPDPTGTDAMTQTVDIETGRTDAEGGGLTQPTTAGTAIDTAVTSTAAAPPPPPTTTTR